MKKFACLLMFTLMMTGCSKMGTGSKTNVAKDTRGKWISERTYVNEAFDVAVDIPKDWHLSKKLHKNLTEGASDMLAGDNKNMKGAYKSAMERMHTAFVAFRYPPGTPGKSNPNVSMIIENVGHLPGIKSGKDYLLLMEENLNNSNMKVDFHGPPKDVSLGAVTFSSRNSTLKIGALKIAQTCYVKKSGACVMVITASTLTEADGKVVQDLTKTIRPAGTVK